MGLYLRKLFYSVLTMVLVACGVGARGQSSGGGENRLRAPLAPLTALPMPPSPFEEELRAMTQQAGVIFAGQVLSVHTQSALGSGTGWMEIDFHVEEAVRGCVGQGTYVLREWAGLWAGGLDRYKAGQRLLMLLHTPSAAGMSSPVGGQDGAIPIIGSAAAVSEGDGSVAAAGANDAAVDVRWLEARMVRGEVSGQRLHVRPVRSTGPVRMGSRKEVLPGVRSNARFEANRLVGAGFSPAETAVEGSVNVAGVSNALAQAPTLRGVLAMLGAWEAQQPDAAR